VKKAVIITARSNSSRLNNKILMQINSKHKAIDILISRAKKIKLPIILATTKKKTDDKLYKYVKKKYKIEVYRGENQNKLKRWHKCFLKFNISKAAIIDGDDIFFDYKTYRAQLDQLDNNDILSAPKSMITGLFTHIISFKAMEKMKIFFNKDIDSEMIEPFIKKAKVKRKFIKTDNIYLNKKIRLTLDYIEDLRLLKFLSIKFKISTDSKNIVEFLIKNNQFSNMNYFREKYWKNNQSKKIKSLVI
jgi:spore coat polysaccharide biosynthesis protein SpsF (cytidylyltransferase family)